MTTVKPKGEAVESPVHWMKRLQVRNEVLAGADFALGQKLPPTQRLILESRRVNFVKNFDAIEECAGDEILAAIEAAFHMGKHAGLMLFAKEAPAANSAIMRGEKATKIAPKLEAKKAAVRAAMEKSRTKPTKGEAYARTIEKNVAERLGSTVPVSTILRYVRAILQEQTQK